MLTEDVQPHGPRGLYADLLTIQAVAQHLEDLINDLIPTLNDPPSSCATRALTRLRHDLRTPLHQIIGYCDLWLEDEDETAAVDRFRADLESLRATGRELNSRIEKLRALDPDRAEPTTLGGDAAIVQQMVANGRRVRRWPSDPTWHRADCSSWTTTSSIATCWAAGSNARGTRRPGHSRQARARTARPRTFDVVLLDFLMPEMNGLEVLQRFKADERLRHLPVIMISALNDIDGVAHCITLGADDYLPRPYNQAILKARIDALSRTQAAPRSRCRARGADSREKNGSMDYCSSSCRPKSSANCKRPAECSAAVRARGRAFCRHRRLHALLRCPFTGGSGPAASAARRAIRAVGGGVRSAEDQDDWRCVHGRRGALSPDRQCRPRLRALRPSSGGGRGRGATALEGACRHTRGSVMGGVVGTRQYLFDIWGDTVNTAARIEHNGAPMRVTLSAGAWSRIAHCCRGTSRGSMELKGKGAVELVQFEGIICDGRAVSV